MKWLLMIIAALIPALSMAQGESSAALYNRANALYTDGKYEEAIELYEKIVHSGIKNPRVEFNLGNAYLKKNPPELAKSILHYEKARTLDPRDGDIKFNLNYANALIKGRLPRVKRGFLHKAWDKLMRNISPGEAIALSSLFYFLLTAALLLYALSRDPRLRRLLAWTCVAAALLFFLQATVAWGVGQRAIKDRAVITENELPVLSGPGENNKELFKLYEGMVVTRVDCRGGWCGIAVPGGLLGWIPQQKAESL